MTVELVQKLSLGAFIIAGILLLIAVALFFILDVRKLIGDVSGANARKAIENIRQQNESTGNKVYKPSVVNAERGKLTDRISPSGEVIQKNFSPGGSLGTEKFSTTEIAPQGNETAVLYQAEPAFGSGPEFAIDMELSFVGSSELIE